MVSASANWMLSLSVPFLVYEMTQSPTWLGLAAVASNGPSVIASPLGGVWADRYSRRVVLLLALAAQTLLALALFWTSRTGVLGVGPLLGLAALMGFASSTNLSAYQAFLADVVPPRQIGPAYRLNAIQFNLSRAIGPALAGFVLAVWGAGTAFLINAICYLPLVAALCLVTSRPRPAVAATSILAELFEGARVSWAELPLRLALITVTTTALFGMSIQPLIAGLAKDVFRVEEAGLGMLVSAVGVSAATTSILIVWIGERLRHSVMIRLGLVAYGVGLMVVAASDVFAIGMIGFAITGFAHVLVNVSVTTSIQMSVSETFRGRVTSLQLMGIIVSMPIGAQIGGLVAESIGLPAVVAIFGSFLIAFAAVAQWRLGGLRLLD